jgi:hypothetical protein
VQLFPGAKAINPTEEALVEQDFDASENSSSKLDKPGTLHATWPSAVGLAPATKVQVRPGLHGSGPLSTTVLPPKRYRQFGTTAEHSAAKKVNHYY